MITPKDKVKSFDKENLAKCVEIQRVAKQVLKSAKKRGIEDIRFTCIDKDIEQAYEKQAHEKEMAKLLGIEE